MSTDTRVSFGSMAVLVEAVEGNAELNGVLPFEFSGGEILNVVLFSRNTTRVVTPLNASSFRMLAETSSLCESLSTVRKSRSSSEVGRFSVIGSESPVTVFGFPYELTAKAGEVSLCNIPSVGISYRNYFQERFDETTGKSFIPIIVQASHFSGDTTFKVEDVSYQVVGVWDVKEGATSSGDVDPETGGGGVTIIPDGGEIEGTYQGDVLCLGAVTITGGLRVQGSLNTKKGECTILSLADGNDITIEGNWLSSGVYTQMGAIVESNIKVYGDWIFNNVLLVTGNAFEKVIYILGSLIQNTEASFMGESYGFRTVPIDGQSGIVIVVNENLLVVTLDGIGSQAEVSTGTAGNGSHLYVIGDIKASFINLSGGPVDHVSEGIASIQAGNGGSISCQGNIVCTNISLDGGSNNTAVTGIGGHGGSISSAGSLTSESISAAGGLSKGTAGNSGGNVEIKGFMTVTDTLNVSGGSSEGIVEGDPEGEAGSTGSIFLYGGGSIKYLVIIDGEFGLPNTSDPAGLDFAGTLTVSGVQLGYRENIYIVAEAGSILRVNSMSVKDQLHHIVGSDFIASPAINDYTQSSIFLSTGKNTDWMIISGTPLSDLGS